jgi:hypothetical protein
MCQALRQRLARFVCKTLPFSKSDVIHEICLRLFLHPLQPLACLTRLSHYLLMKQGYFVSDVEVIVEVTELLQNARRARQN